MDEETNNLEPNETRSATPVNLPTPTMPIQKQLLVLTGVLGSMFVLGGAITYLAKEPEAAPTEVVPESFTVAVAESESDTSFSNISLLAESAIVIDLNSQTVYFEKAADDERPLASITKLMTALVAKEIVDQGTTVPITASALRQSGESGLGLGERFEIEDLSDLVLLMSSNDGAYALAASAGTALNSEAPETAFVKAMNVRARELGLSHTTFRNPTGLDISLTEAGAYGTAREVATLMAYIVENYPELLTATTKAESLVVSETGEVHDANNTNRVVGEIAQVLGSKTGYTTLAGGNLVVAFDVGLDRPLVAAVLGSSYQGRFSDMVKLVEATKNELDAQD